METYHSQFENSTMARCAEELLSISRAELLFRNIAASLYFAQLAVDIFMMAEGRPFQSTGSFRAFQFQFPHIFVFGDRKTNSSQKEKKKMSTFRGKTEEADSVFLDAKFWRPGVKISGRVIRTFESENGPCYVIELLDPVEVAGENVDQVSVGNLTGFRMALQAAGLDCLKSGDSLHLKCTSLKSTTKGSPRPNFELEVTRS
jgi:hypothetical protein